EHMQGQEQRYRAHVQADEQQCSEDQFKGSVQRDERGICNRQHGSPLRQKRDPSLGRAHLGRTEPQEYQRQADADHYRSVRGKRLPPSFLHHRHGQMNSWINNQLASTPTVKPASTLFARGSLPCCASNAAVPSLPHSCKMAWAPPGCWLIHVVKL